ncbi:hypothetical protein K505DRAFT_326341 [Melanomma pulvis-pyrius CBS 109.77]|uniref:Retrotransposon Copia-like N-terminal domain-containing protein n=1 Tax=Melanomma pulvis-pyrius CBS 109.77 TaxID=1314802 RepID=A0A6A6X8G0_9PLEO|nr:hypothetical protein K505DRAFT_326341 [Melanomma pulvis-pyrius CBS 109.77]
MAPTLMSPRVPGVSILAPNATGPQYARWRRGVKAVFTAKGTWGHCDGSVPMPMPESGPNFFSPATSSNPQPGLLEERRAWVKKDRDVKLDLFLSVADEIKIELFEVGPPLPPSAMTALEMVEALDERYHTFKFEDYHHVFCHFLNLHIDQYANLEDFNNEFQATLNDLLDHGAPMSNMQACSAYFSKLRCTQNPWVAKKLKDWDTSEETPLLKNLMKECPPWIIIRPLATKATAQQSTTDSIPEENLEDSHGHSSSSDGEAASDRSEVSTISSQSSHSRQASDSSQRSQEITIHASYEDLTDLTDSFPMPATVVSSKASIAKMAPLPPINRPLPPLPSAVSSTRSRSVSPNHPPTRLETTLKVSPPSPPSARPQTPSDQVHPALRSTTPTTPPQNAVHPALRARTPTPPPTVQSHIASVMRSTTPTPPLQPTVFTPNPVARALSPSPPPPPTIFTSPKPMARASTPSPPLPQLTFSSSSLFPPNSTQRPSSSRSMMAPHSSSMDTFSSYAPTRPLMRIESSSSSVISLPLQGNTTPEYHDTLITEHSTPPSNLRLSNSPPRSIISRLSAESAEDEKKSRKRSWSIKARLSSRRYEVREMI